MAASTVNTLKAVIFVSRRRTLFPIRPSQTIAQAGFSHPAAIAPLAIKHGPKRDRILARFPASWNQLAEKESRQINMLEQILVAEVFNFSGICSSLAILVRTVIHRLAPLGHGKPASGSFRDNQPGPGFRHDIPWMTG
jgi:hypothetical protein